MGITTTLRFLLKKYSAGDDPHPTRTDYNAMIDALENNAALYSEGITSARPAAGKRGRFYWDTTALRLFYDNGTDWMDLNPNGGGGAGAKIVPGAAAVEGVAARAARADHTHLLDLATGIVDGAMRKEDKAKLDAATAAATANALVLRDATGRVNVAAPIDAGNAATKQYVDNADATLTASIGGVSARITNGADFPFGHMGATAGFQDINPSGIIAMAAAQLLQGGMTFSDADDALVAPKNGFYRVAIRAYCSGGTYPSRFEFKARRNGTDLNGARVSVYKGDASDYYSYCEARYQLNAGDKISLFGGGSSTAGSSWGTDGYNGTFVELEFVRDA